MSKTILIVDDSTEDSVDMGEMVRNGGFDVIFAPDGKSGVRMAKEKIPALIIMDVEMPDINGFKATSMIVKNPETANIPVVICSNGDKEDFMFWSIENGAKHYFPKPANAVELVSKIKELIG